MSALPHPCCAPHAHPCPPLSWGRRRSPITRPFAERLQLLAPPESPSPCAACRDVTLSGSHWAQRSSRRGAGGDREPQSCMGTRGTAPHWGMEGGDVPTVARSCCGFWGQLWGTGMREQRAEHQCNAQPECGFGGGWDTRVLTSADLYGRVQEDPCKALPARGSAGGVCIGRSVCHPTCVWMCTRV